MVEIGVALDEGNPGGSASGNQVALNDGNSAVDLIIERPTQTTLVIEIKSGKRVSERDLSNLVAITKEMENAEAICLYDGSEKLRYHDVELLPWRIGISDKIFGRRYFNK
jgi:hypothetical protein